MEALTAQPTRTPTATEQVALLIKAVPADRLEAALRAALQRQLQGQQSLEEQHLGFVEQGWENSWQLQYDHKKALETEIIRVLAERFGA